MAAVRTAHGLIAAYMNLCGFKGWTSFWGVIYVLPGNEYDERERQREYMTDALIDYRKSPERDFDRQQGDEQ